MVMSTSGNNFEVCSRYVRTLPKLIHPLHSLDSFHCEYVLPIQKVFFHWLMSSKEV